MNDITAQKGGALAHECDKEHLIKITIAGQKKIFEKLDAMGETLRAVAVQQNEIQHIRRDLDELKLACDKRHAKTPEPVSKRLVEAIMVGVAVSASLAVFWLFAYIGFVNVKGFLNFQQDPVIAEKQGGENAKSEKTHP